MDVVTMWTGPAMVGMLVVLLGAALWSLARETGRIWRLHEDRRHAVSHGAQAFSTVGASVSALSHPQRGIEVVARVRQGAGGPIEAVAVVPRDDGAGGECGAFGAFSSCDDSELRGMDIAREVRRLAALATPQEEIACRVGIALAEVRLLIAMQAARASRPGSR